MPFIVALKDAWFLFMIMPINEPYHALHHALPVNESLFHETLCLKHAG
jgi:hypothetical protein